MVEEGQFKCVCVYVCVYALDAHLSLDVAHTHCII